MENVCSVAAIKVKETRCDGMDLALFPGDVVKISLAQFNQFTQGKIDLNVGNVIYQLSSTFRLLTQFGETKVLTISPDPQKGVETVATASQAVFANTRPRCARRLFEA